MLVYLLFNNVKLSIVTNDQLDLKFCDTSTEKLNRTVATNQINRQNSLLTLKWQQNSFISHSIAISLQIIDQNFFCAFFFGIKSNGDGDIATVIQLLFGICNPFRSSASKTKTTMWKRRESSDICRPVRAKFTENNAKKLGVASYTLWIFNEQVINLI